MLKDCCTVFLVSSLLLCGCENAQFRNREKGALAGGALGAGLGAIVGRHTGGTGAGIAIGSAVGALSGGLIGNSFDNQEDAQREIDSRVEANERELAENRRILEELKRNGIEARVTKRGVVANLPDVLFDFDSASLTPSSRHTVRELADVIKGANGRRVSVEGHTDAVGTESYNQRLSEDRAETVARALEGESVSRSQLRAKGFGETQPIASNGSASGRSRNRRVEVIIENK